MIEPARALELLELQLDALLRRDANGRSTSWSGVQETPAPYVFLGRSAGGNRWRVWAGLPDALAAEVDALCRAEPIASDFNAEPECAPALRQRIGEHCELGGEYRGVALILPDTLPSPGNVRGEAAPLRVSRWISGVRVARCHCAALTARAAEAGVETHPDWRGRGHATDVVAVWASLVQRTGRLALYSTEHSNTASLAVAHRLGAEPYGENFHLDSPRSSSTNAATH